MPNVIIPTEKLQRIASIVRNLHTCAASLAALECGPSAHPSHHVLDPVGIPAARLVAELAGVHPAELSWCSGTGRLYFQGHPVPRAAKALTTFFDTNG